MIENTQAILWFRSLEPVTNEKALEMLVDGESIPTLHGTRLDHTPRADVIAAIEKDGARLAPDTQGILYQYHQLVTMNEDSWPMQFRTKDEFAKRES